MKYDIKVTAILVSFFFLAQVIGLALVNGSIADIEEIDGQIVVEYSETLVERPEMSASETFVFFIIIIAIATIILLVIAKLNLAWVWKAWFFLGVWITITISLAVFINPLAALAAALVLAALKIFRRNFIIHNVTELLVYSGIVIIFVPLFDVFWVFVLLLAISVYDIVAVRKTRHMVDMAMFLDKTRLFAGLSFPLEKISGKEKPKVDMEKGRIVEKKVQSAIIGGGDIAFPMLFAGVAMQGFITGGIGRVPALGLGIVISIFVTISLLFLFFIAKKGRFYPAIPFITIGCAAGYLASSGVAVFL